MICDDLDLSWFPKGPPRTDSIANYETAEYPAIKHIPGKYIAKLMELNLVNGPWLAGGMVRRLVSGHLGASPDWDIWFANPEQFDRAYAKVRNLQEATIVADTPNAVTFSIEILTPSGIYATQLQLIRREYFKNAASVIHSFDFTICQLLTDGDVIVTGVNTISDLQNKKIALVNPSFDITTRGFFSRILKYVTYGFAPNAEILELMKSVKPSHEWGDVNAY